MTSREIMSSRPGGSSRTRCSKRAIRSAMKVLMATVLVIFVCVNVMYMFFASLDHRMDTFARDVIKDRKDHHMALEVSDIEPDINGNVKIQLTLKVNELLRFLEGGGFADGEATNNPPPPEIKYLINVPAICEKSKDLKYIIYVHTSPDHYEKRNMLRTTWASLDLFNERILERVFLMGRSDDAKIQKEVDKESEKHKDIIQGDFHDNYRNLTLKGMMGLQWVSTYCKNAKFAIKADDDAFVDIFNFLHLLEKHEDKKKVLACPLWGERSMPILRDPSKCAKWCVHFDEFPGMRYFPKYCAGLTFALSSDLVSAMHTASKSTPFFWIDDVYITGLLPEKVKDVEFVKLLQNFTLKANEAMADLKNTSKPYTKMFVHAKEPKVVKDLWNLLLKRLSLEDIKTISTDFIERNAVLKSKLGAGGHR